MRNKKYLWIIVMAVALGSAILAGCGPGGTEFTYRVTGTASEATIKYTNADGEPEETTANLPWEKTFNVGNEFQFQLTIINQSGSGTVICEALIDGDRSLGKADGNTSVSCSGSFYKKGSSLTKAFSSAADTVAPPATPTPIATPTPSASEHMDLGIEYIEQGQLEEAIAEFKAVIELEPDNPDAHRNLGTAYGEQGKWEEAAAAYEKAIELAPDFGEAYGDLVAAYFGLGKIAEAIAAGEKAIELAPNYAMAHNNLGVAYAMQNRLDEAIAETQKAISLDPNEEMAHNNLGRLYSNQGKFNEAIAELEEALRIKADYMEAHYNLALTYARQKEYDKAIAKYEEVLKIEPDHTGSHFDLGIIYRDLGMSDKAIAEFETYLQLRPDAPDRKAVEDEIAKLKESAAGPEYRNAIGGYSLRYPEGWYHTESEAQVVFAESEEALETAPEGAPMVMFIAGPLSEIAESIGLEEITDPVVAMEAMAENFEAEMGEVETGKLASYPAALTNISGTFQGVSYQGGLAVALVEERAVYGVALAPPDQWEAFRPTFVTMVNGLSFFEP
jgi:tetratricopeptide (TPR) repeat protein